MSRREPPTVMLIGDSEQREFAAPLTWLGKHCRCHWYPTIAVAVESLRQAAKAPDWIVLVASYRGAFEHAEVEGLHKRAPLARLLTLLGSWCEGEMRSGRALPGVARAYWHQWEARAAAEMLGERAARYAGWSLPRTSLPLDVSLLARAQPHSIMRRDVATPQLSVLAPTRERYLTLADALRTCGYPSLWQTATTLASAHDSSAFVIDGDSLTQRISELTQHTIACAVDRPTLLLLDFPRWQEVEQAREWGVRRVLSKPYLLGDLRAILAKILPQSAQTAAA